MISSKDINFVGYTYKNFEIVNDYQVPGMGLSLSRDFLACCYINTHVIMSCLWGFHKLTIYILCIVHAIHGLSAAKFCKCGRHNCCYFLNDDIFLLVIDFRSLFFSIAELKKKNSKPKRPTIKSLFGMFIHSIYFFWSIFNLQL